MKQSSLDRTRRFNKQVTNKVMIYIAGKKFGHFVILSHTGRKSGKLYKIPMIAEPAANGFVIALTYGREVDWVKNVLARGSCSMRWKDHEYSLVHPVFIDKELGLSAFPALFRTGLIIMGIQFFLRLEIQQ